LGKRQKLVQAQKWGGAGGPIQRFREPVKKKRKKKHRPGKKREKFSASTKGKDWGEKTARQTVVCKKRVTVTTDDLDATLTTEGTHGSTNRHGTEMKRIKPGSTSVIGKKSEETLNQVPNLQKGNQKL